MSTDGIEDVESEETRQARERRSGLVRACIARTRTLDALPAGTSAPRAAAYICAHFSTLEAALAATDDEWREAVAALLKLQRPGEQA